MRSCWRVRLRWILLIGALWTGQGGADSAIRFLAVGDVPYTESEHLLLESLLTREALGRSPFLVHVGDIKSGGSPCTEAALTRIARVFRRLPVPVVYTPGDNEWTDCRREAAGAYDAQERLSLLRRLFYAEPGILRLQSLGAERTQPDYPENYWFLYRDVLFATVHVVGSQNNRVGGDPVALAEHEARAAANRRHLFLVAEAGKATQAKALVLLFHANAGLEQKAPAPAYRSFREGLGRLLEDFRRPVLAIHGDTHQYRFDQPLADPDTGEPMRRFSRLEVPGSPVVGGVWVNIDAGSREPFQVRLVYPVARDALTEE